MAVVVLLVIALSPWWWLLAVIPTLLFIVGLAAWVVARVIASRVAPSMNKEQRKATKKVVHQVSRVAEQIGTPRFVLIFRIIKDIMFPRSAQRTLIGELTELPGQLHRDFESLRKLF